MKANVRLNRIEIMKLKSCYIEPDKKLRLYYIKKATKKSIFSKIFIKFKTKTIVLNNKK